MTEKKYSRYYDHRHRSRGADMLKLFLMPFVMFVLFGFPTRFGGYIKVYSNFAAPAFYILCGFFVLCPNEKRRKRKLKRALKKTFNLFALMFASYVIINIVFLLSFNSYWIPEMLRIRTWFDFLILNIWPPVFPMGGSIWFIQGLLYAYVFFYFADKIKLLRFYIPLLILFYLIMVSTGEFAPLLGFPHFGYDFIPGGAVTRAIPYMLVGMLVRKNADRFLALRKPLYILFFVVGIALAVLEVSLLSYYHILVYLGHMIGFGIMALSLCCFALSFTKVEDNFITAHGRSYARRIYALCQPVYLIVTLFVGSAIASQYFSFIIEYRSIIVFLVCFALAFLAGFIKYLDRNKSF